MMVDSGVVVKISYKDTCLLDEVSGPLPTNDLESLIAVLKDTQQKTNDCLTRLTKETDTVPTKDKSDDLSEDDSEEDPCDDVECENDISPKRVKLKN